ncbi:MAG: AAA family ATPase [Bacteroidales bacterium]|nr:AAA family ATPase [Bacteroidales bacterium]
MIDRKLDAYIERHYATSKAALLLKGARQTGKTFAIRKFAQRHQYNLIEINFDEDAEAKKIFIGSTSASDVLLRISAHTRSKISHPKTLIFFDEVQKCPEVITWIKFLVDEGSCRYALSGSLLGVELKNIESAPVGYLSIKEVFPLDLEEFARAIGVPDNVFPALRESWELCQPVDEVVHRSMIKMVHLYLVVGGMPAAVQAYLDTNDLSLVEDRQRDILKLYRIDISKYDKDNKLEVDEIFRLLPSELNAKNKRFILKNLNEHARFSRYENGFLWLKNAGVAIPVYNITEPRIPLKLNEQRNLLKLFQNDVGLLASQYASGIQLKLLSGDVNINYGAIYENLVAQELNCHGFGGDDYELYYFNNKKQGELDFVIEQNANIVPIEVKSGKDYERHNALNNVLSNFVYGIEKAYVFCNGNVEVLGNRVYLPIYMLMFIQKNPPVAEQIFRFEFGGV